PAVQPTDAPGVRCAVENAPAIGVASSEETAPKADTRPRARYLPLGSMFWIWLGSSTCSGVIEAIHIARLASPSVPIQVLVTGSVGSASARGIRCGDRVA